MINFDELKDLPNRDDHNCFGCSPTNPCGLHMKFFTDGKSLHTRLIIPQHLCGWDNLVHGGILSTILDETMGWTAIHLLKKFVLTHTMTIRFFKPVYVGEDIRAEGRILEVKGNREVTVEGNLYKVGDPEDMLCATSTGTFRLFSAEAIGRLGIMSEEAAKRFDFLIE